MITNNSQRYTTLLGIVGAWERRWRTQKLVLWLPRLLLVPLAIGVSLAIFSRFYRFLAPQEILLATIGIAIGFMAGFVGWFWFSRRTPLESARYFDVTFDLQERVSSALELMEGRITADRALTHAQLADAEAQANAFAYKRQLALVIRRLDWAIVAGVCVIFAILLLIPNPTSESFAIAQDQQQRISESAETVKDIIEDIANDPNLDATTRQELLQSLQASLDTLENPNVSADEALATLNDVQSVLEQRAQQLAEQSAAQQQAQQQALQQALEALQEAGQEAQSLSDALNQIEEQLAQSEAGDLDDGNMDETTQSQADALRQAAEQLSQTDSALSQSLERAAESLEQGDNQAAQEALQRAQEQLAQSQNQPQQEERASQNLTEAAEQLQQAQEQIAPQPQNQQQQEMAQNQGEQSDQQQGEQQQDGQSQEGESDDQQSDSDQQGDTAGQNPGDENPQLGDGDQQGDAISNSQQNQTAQTSILNEAAPVDNIGGDAPGDLTQDTSGVSINPSDPQQQQSRDNAGGQSQYEAIFAPQRLGGQGGEEIILAPDIDDVPIREGNFTDNEAGAITVPYNEVFNTYFGNANTALDQGYIPLGLRDVIRQYFTSLAPRSNSGQ